MAADDPAFQRTKLHLYCAATTPRQRRDTHYDPKSGAEWARHCRTFVIPDDPVPEGELTCPVAGCDQPIHVRQR